MGAIELGPKFLRNQPVASQRNAAYALGVQFHRLFPFCKIDGSGKGREHDKLRERDARALSHVDRSIKRTWPVAGQSEDERTEHMHAVLAERLQAFDEIFPRAI